MIAAQLDSGANIVTAFLSQAGPWAAMAVLIMLIFAGTIFMLARVHVAAMAAKSEEMASQDIRHSEAIKSLAIQTAADRDLQETRHQAQIESFMVGTSESLNASLSLIRDLQKK